MKGRGIKSLPPIDHAANLRERLGQVAYEAAFDHIPVPWEQADEPRRERYRHIGQAVMDAIIKRGKGHGQVHVGSLVSTANGKPYVELTLDASPAQLTPAKAREIALLLFEVADASEGDAVVMAFARDSIGLDDVRAAQLLDQFRRYRESMRGKDVDAA